MLDHFKQDAQRWVVLGQVASPGEVTPKVLLLLLFRYPGLRATAWFRLGSWLKQKRVPLLPGICQRLILRHYGLDIVIGQEINGGLYIPHPAGTVISAQRVGINCSIIASITIGMRNEWKFPEIGDNVFIGAGARLLGGITVGNNVKIGANAVVLHDIPDGATVVGVPGQVLQVAEVGE